MKSKLLFFSVLFAMLGTVMCFSQEKQLSGVVTSGQDGLPLPGVNVIIDGTTKGTQTDFDGRYTINTSIGNVLVFSYVGMVDAKVKVTANTSTNVVMQEDVSSLDEVLVVAYGTATKGGYTGSATQIKTADIENRGISNISSALEGASAGVSVTAGSGQPGSGQEIRIRGFGSYSASSDPLYVVDGIVFNGYLNSINPNDIESVTILKDASSTALYGNKAANGVVMITTKSGKNQKGEFSFNISNSIVNRSIPEYDRLNPSQYYEVMWEALRNSRALPGIDSETDLAAANTYASANIYRELLNNPFNVANDEIVGTDGTINPNARLKYNDIDWVDAVTRLGYRQNYDISYRGGSEKGGFYASLGYLNEEGYLLNSDFSRVSGRVNANYEAAKWLKTGINVGITTSRGNQAQAASTQSNSFVNPIRFSRGIGPIYNIYKHDESGAYILDNNGKRIYDINASRPDDANNGRHIVAEMLWNKDIDEITSINSRTFFDFKLTNDITFTTNISFDQRHFYNTDFENKIVGDGATAGRSGRTYNRRTTVGFNQLLKYKKSFSNHNLDALLAHESLSEDYNVFDGSKQGQIVDGNTELINYVTTQDLFSYVDKLRDESYFGRLNYDYNGKYYLSASYREDGTSKFSKEKRWGSFWSFGGAWRIDQEAFAENASWINYLKFRASYGEVGNNSGIDWFAYQGLYDLDYNNQSGPGYIQASLENRGLFWETSASYDFALEFTLFDRLQGTVEYYNRNSDNLLFEVPLPLSSGTESIYKNIGSLYNRGVELTLGYDIIKNQNFNWNFGVNAATINNKFTKLPQEEIIDGSKKLMVGHSIYDYWLKNWYGVDPADGAALYIPTEDAIEAADDDIRTVNGVTVTTKQGNAAYHYAGTAIPDLTGSITNKLTYKGFGLNCLFTYQLGGETLDYSYRNIMSSGSYGGALSTDILRRWQKPGDITDVPRMDPTETTNFDATSDRWLVDASYFNLRQVSLSYDVQRNFLDKINASALQLYLSAENVFSINAKKGMNIQQSFNGTTENRYTPSRIITLGLNVKF